MAQVKDVTLNIENTGVSKRKVTVGFKLQFNKSEAGRKYSYDIKLMSEDLPGDPDGTPAASPEVRVDYRFRKPIDHVFAIGTPRKTITATEGEKNFSDERTISSSTLNEDPGFAPDQEPNEPLVYAPDELFAEVSLWTEPPFLGGASALLSKRRSATQKVTIHG